jgi:hypothetical protein
VAFLVGDLLDDLAELEEFDLAKLIVVAGLDLLVLAVPLAGGLSHRLLEGTDDLISGDALVLGDLVDFSFQVRTEH